MIGVENYRRIKFIARMSSLKLNNVQCSMFNSSFHFLFNNFAYSYYWLRTNSIILIVCVISLRFVVVVMVFALSLGFLYLYYCLLNEQNRSVLSDDDDDLSNRNEYADLKLLCYRQCGWLMKRMLFQHFKLNQLSNWYDKKL